MKLPCGCEMRSDVIDGVPTLVWVACAAGVRCRWLRYAMEENERQGKSTTILDAS